MTSYSKYRPRPHDPKLDHVIRQTTAGFDLVTHYGYVLKSFKTLAEARGYYARHCPADFSEGEGK